MKKLETIQKKLKELRLYREYLLNIKILNELKNGEQKVKKVK